MEEFPALRIAIVGTSHINCIQDALPLLRLEESCRLAPFFFGLNAPVLSKQNSVGWPEESGVMSCNIPEGRALLKRLFADADRRFVPIDFDVVLLVDFFFCLDFAYLLRDSGTRSLRVGGIPVSDAAYTRILAHRLGQSSYSANSAVGFVAENSMLPKIEQMTASAPRTRFFLMPRPAQPASNKVAQKILFDREDIARAMRLFDRAAENVLKEVRVTYLPPSPDQVCLETGLTPDRYSRGVHPSRPSLKDEHVTGEYGAIAVRRILRLLDQQGG